MRSALLSLAAVAVLSSTARAGTVMYDRISVKNYAQFGLQAWAHFAACKTQWFHILPAKPDGKGGITPGGVDGSAPGGNACLLTKIHIEADRGAPSVSIADYSSSGTSYRSYLFLPQNGESPGPAATSWRMYSNSEYKAATTTAKMSPGFSIKNNTKWPLAVGLYQIGCLYHGTVPPGGTFDRNTGAVWFTVRANIQPDGKDPVSDWDCAAPIAAVVGSALLAAVTAGASAAAMPAMAAALAPIATSQAVTITGAVVAAGATAAATSSGVVTAIGQALVKNSAGFLAGQYAGYAWPFRCDQKPTYEISGGWGNIAPDGSGGYQVDPGTPLTIKKTNTCGNDMMKGSKTSSP